MYIHTSAEADSFAVYRFMATFSIVELYWLRIQNNTIWISTYTSVRWIHCRSFNSHICRRLMHCSISHQIEISKRKEKKEKKLKELHCQRNKESIKKNYYVLKDISVEDMSLWVFIFVYTQNNKRFSLGFIFGRRDFIFFTWNIFSLGNIFRTREIIIYFACSMCILLWGLYYYYEWSRNFFAYRFISLEIWVYGVCLVDPRYYLLPKS